MNFLLQPLRFFAALKELAQKRLVPTELDTAQLRELDASIRRQALFVARMTQLRALQTLKEGLEGMLEGKDNLATAKLMMVQSLRELGYDAEAGGFPQDAAGTVPPARRGSLRDLASDQRMTLTITTNYRIAANQAFVAKGVEERRLHLWPCYELVRIGRVRTPRGFKRRKGALEVVPGDDWPSRFVAAGGELWDKGTRMIAPKLSDVWQKLGDGAGGHTDTLGNPFAPFAFGSKYGLREVARDEALLLGVIKPTDDATRAMVRDYMRRNWAPLEKELGKMGDHAPRAVVPRVQSKAEAAGLDPALIRSMKRDLAVQQDGTIRLKRELDKELAAADAAYKMRNRMITLVGLLNARAARTKTAMRAPVDRSAAAKKGWATRRANGWTPQARPGRAAVQRMKTEAREGAASLRLALSHKQDVPSGMTTRHGKMDFPWGRPGHTRPNERGDTHTDGYGISHIHTKRGMTAIRRLPVVLARGRMLPHEEPNRRILQYGGWSAIIEEKGEKHWRVITLIDDLVFENPKKKGMRAGVHAMIHKPLIKQPKNKAARHPCEMTGPTTKVDAGEEHPGPTHTAQRLAKDGVVASKDSRLLSLHARCNMLLNCLHRASGIQQPASRAAA